MSEAKKRTVKRLVAEAMAECGGVFTPPARVASRKVTAGKRRETAAQVVTTWRIPLAEPLDSSPYARERSSTCAPRTAARCSFAATARHANRSASTPGRASSGRRAISTATRKWAPA
jgi:hypothetical protein